MWPDLAIDPSTESAPHALGAFGSPMRGTSSSMQDSEMIAQELGALGHKLADLESVWSLSSK